MSTRRTFLSRPAAPITDSLTPVLDRPVRRTRRERREERELLAQLASRPANMRDELLEMIYRAN